MPRKRSLPVLIVLLLLIGIDALWTLRSTPALAVPEPVIVHHQRIGSEDRYSGELLLPACAQLQSGIGSGDDPMGVQIDLEVTQNSGPCTAGTQTFLLTYAGDARPFGGVTIGGSAAAYQVVEDQ
jgi:hypothetical protein